MEGLLASFGFRRDRVARHGALWAPPLPGRPVVVPQNKRALPDGTTQAILREAGITREAAMEFWGLQ
jgi:hypothetical protein